MSYEDPANIQSREKKTRFTEADYAVVSWWANQLGLTTSALIRQLTLEGLARIAVGSDHSGRQEGRAQ